MSTAGAANSGAAGHGGTTTAPAVAPLPYADLPARWGVSVERLADGVRVVVPPLRWRQLHVGYYLGGTILALLLAYVALMAYEQGDWVPFLGGGVTYGIGLAAVLLAAAHRLRRRLVLEVTGHTVSVTRLTPRGPGRRSAWPRAAVGEIRLSAGDARKLLVRVSGVALVEVYLGPNRALNAHVADVLAAALREPVRAQAVEPAPPPAAGERPNTDGVRSPRARRALLALAALMAVLGVAVLLLPFDAARGLGIYLLLFAIAPAGIALGTQDKEYYV